ncbi:UbiA family prenyltransferase [Muricoccus radiodurans]|uniref:UbiA family prenyltransferase n=1 Tax=Muricoccus radiodurans TaxID=2231721 RepID=UPI003CF92156
MSAASQLLPGVLVSGDQRTELEDRLPRHEPSYGAERPRADARLLGRGVVAGAPGNHRLTDAAAATATTREGIPFAPAVEGAGALLPIVVDLDGTLIRSDLLVESALALLRADPATAALRTLGWLARGGRAGLKAEIARRAPLPDPAALPYDNRLLAWLNDQRVKGRRIVLATASDHYFAQMVADHLGLFDEVLASDGCTNLKGAAKVKALRARFPDGFVYCGDAVPDLEVWRASAGAVPVNARPSVRARVTAPVLAEFPPEPVTVSLWLRALRVHQWSKNFLVLAPLFLTHRYGDPAAWTAALLGIVALGFVASGTYLLNDLLDLSSDRAHWTKRNRPLASGRIPVTRGLAVAPVLIGGGLLLAALLGPLSLIYILAYLSLTLLYSLRLKGEPILDVAAIAALFTLRLAYGLILVGSAFSPWLLSFAGFLFFSLALAKRHTECVGLAARGDKVAVGRGWHAGDAPLTLALGVASTVGAVLIFLVYLTLDAMPAGSYRDPAALWGIPALISLWCGRVWLLANRGEMHDDPVAFAVRDRRSLLFGAAACLCFLIAL